MSEGLIWLAVLGGLFGLVAVLEWVSARKRGARYVAGQLGGFILVILLIAAVFGVIGGVGYAVSELTGHRVDVPCIQSGPDC